MSDWTDLGFPCPLLDGYGYTRDVGLLRSAPDSGRKRQAQGWKDKRETYDLRFMIEGHQLDELEAFFIEDAYSWFTLPLANGDAAGLADYTARAITPYSLSPVGTNGRYWMVAFQAETQIAPVAPDLSEHGFPTTEEDCCLADDIQCCGDELVCTPVTLTTWTADYYGWPGATQGTWTLNESDLSVYLWDSDPNNVYGTSFFYGDLTSSNREVVFRCSCISDPDDDYLGIAIGYNAGDTSNPSANFLLFAWKQATQLWTGGTALIGTSVSLVTGVPTFNEIFVQRSFEGDAGGVTVLARGLAKGSVGYAINTEYEVRIRTEAGRLRIWVDDALDFDLSVSVPGGVFAFYNCSQRGVTYAIDGCAEDLES